MKIGNIVGYDGHIWYVMYVDNSCEECPFCKLLSINNKLQDDAVFCDACNIIARSISEYILKYCQ
jgi:hypothetical protein